MDIDQPLEERIQEKKPAVKKEPRSAPRTSSGSDRKPYERPPAGDINQSWKHDQFQANTRGYRGASDRSNIPAARIKISGLHYEIMEKDLASLFSTVGTIVEGPTLHYDRSGRSKGEAHILYSSREEATSARQKFDGQNAKGQPITIVYDAGYRPFVPGGSRDQAPVGGDLMRRLAPEKGASTSAPRNGPSTSRGSSRPDRGARSSSDRGAPRGGRGGRGGRSERGPKRGPATQDDLDKELEAFVAKDDKPAVAAAIAPTPAAAAEPAPEGAMEL